MSIEERIQAGIDGKYEGLANGFDRINDYIFGIQRKAIYLIGGQSGTFKTTMLDFQLINALEYAEKNNIELHIIYNSFEIDKLTKQCNWLSVRIFQEHGVIVNPETIKGFGKNRLNSYQKELVDKELPYIKKLFSKIIWNFTSSNPTGCNKQIWEFMKTKGTFITEDYIDDNGKVQKKVIGFTHNNPEAYYIMATDHLYLLSKERGFNTKENIDKFSEYQVAARNLFGFTFINLQQFNSGISSVERVKFKGIDLSPQQSDFRDSTNPYSDADVVLGLLNPFKLDIDNCIGYDIKILKQKFVQMKIIKNRFSKDNIAIGLLALPEYGSFKELPKVGTKELQEIYDSL